MEITLIDNVSKSELAEIKKMIGEAFITNELFHEFGDINDRKELVMKYMDIYTDYVYESKALYGTENHKGIVGFIHSKKASVYPQLKMLIRLLKVIPFKTLKSICHILSKLQALISSMLQNPILIFCLCVWIRNIREKATQGIW